MRLVLIGYGRMGRLVEELSSSYGFEVADRLDIDDNANGQGISAERLHGVDVAIDFSTAPAVAQNLPKLAALGINLVVGTTGWQAHEADLKRVAIAAAIGVVAAPNFSLGANVFQAIAEHTARLFRQHDEYGAWVHELHHARQAGRAVRYGSGARGPHGTRRIPRSYRRCVNPSGIDAGNPHGRVRWTI